MQRFIYKCKFIKFLSLFVTRIKGKNNEIHYNCFTYKNEKEDYAHKSMKAFKFLHICNENCFCFLMQLQRTWKRSTVVKFYCRLSMHLYIRCHMTNVSLILSTIPITLLNTIMTLKLFSFFFSKKNTAVWQCTCTACPIKSVYHLQVFRFPSKNASIFLYLEYNLTTIYSR